MTIVILLVILGGAGIWMYRLGQSKQKLAQAEADLEGVAKIHTMGNVHETETDSIMAVLNALDNSDRNGPPRLPRTEIKDR